MEKRNGKEDHEGRPPDMELSVAYNGRPRRKCKMLYSLVLLLLLVISLVSTATRLQNIALPSFGFSDTSDSDKAKFLLGQENEDYWCDRSDRRTDVCYIQGNVHLFPEYVEKKVLLQLYSNDKSTWHGEEEIRPFTRKYDASATELVEYVTLRSKYLEFFQPVESACGVKHSAPLLVFSAGGFTGNLYHDFQDVLVPLFITSRFYEGHVVFGITQAREWWLRKFKPLLELMTKHNIIDLKRDKEVHCFPEAVIGLRVHGELKVDPTLMPHNESMKDFQLLLQEAYGGGEDNARTKIQEGSRCLRSRASQSWAAGCKLKLVIVARNDTRVILNQSQVASLAQKEGFDVQILTPWGGSMLTNLYRIIHNADVMMGVHGAALTHMLFMRPRSVLIQIVPLGTNWPSLTYFQEPAVNRLDLQYVEYRITPEESTLSRIYGRDHAIVKDPEAFIAKKWETRKKIYMQGQDVRLALPKLKLALRDAKRLALQSLDPK
ncbi:hypothetical protein R1sor_005877 [Riccia sorocarpa]|uniref:Glycosyltransferase 61 catalytic domain-containing protein n=1 Tax=Riccia sorocarpa TaxID=122646 RepID=A0ABD3HN47_9MARC